MPVKYLGKGKGYPFRMLNPRRNEIVWEWCKEHLKNSVDDLRQFRRAPMNLRLLYEALQKYDVIPPKKTESSSLVEAELWVKDKFASNTKLPLHKFDAIQQSELPSGTNPGYPYFQKGLTTKLDAWSEAYSDSHDILKNYINGNRSKFFPCLAFCRSKVEQRDHVKLRFIFGVSLCTLILQRIFSQPLWHYYRTHETPAAYQNTLYYGGYPKLLKEMLNAKASVNNNYTVYMSDFKNYDTSCGTWVTKKCYDILFNNLDFEKFDDGTENPHPEAYKRLFWDLMRHDIDTEIIMPDGHRWQKFNGDSTGSQMFQLMQNIRTCLINQSAMHAQTGSVARFMKSLGDDCIWSSRESFDFEKGAKYIEETFGPTYSVQKCSKAVTYDQIGFLGRRFFGIGPTRNMFDVLTTILYPETECDNYVLMYMRIVAMFYENCGGDSRVEYLLRHLSELIPIEMRKKMEKASDFVEWPLYYQRRFQAMGFSKMPKLKLPMSRLFLFKMMYEEKKNLNMSRLYALL
jgi:hypothetical protein